MVDIDRTKTQTIYYYILTKIHPPQIINQLPKIINEHLSRNSSDEEVFHSFKYQYEQTLRDSG